MFLPIYFLESPHKYPIPQRSKYIWSATKKTHTILRAMLKFKFSIHLRRSYTQLNHMHLLIRNLLLSTVRHFQKCPQPLKWLGFQLANYFASTTHSGWANSMPNLWKKHLHSLEKEELPQNTLRNVCINFYHLKLWCI